MHAATATMVIIPGIVLKNLKMFLVDFSTLCVVGTTSDCGVFSFSCEVSCTTCSELSEIGVSEDSVLSSVFF